MLEPPEEVAGVHVKRVGDANDVAKRGVARPPLEPPHVATVEAGHLGQRLLGQAQLDPPAPDPLPEQLECS